MVVMSNLISTKDMKKITNHFGIISIILLLIFACGEANKEMFKGPESIYFRVPQGDTTLIIREDTIVFSFAFDLNSSQREILIPVEISGFPTDYDRKYMVEVTNIGDTKAGIHYETISKEQVLPAGKMTDSLKVIFYRTEDMGKSAKKIGISIQDGGELIKGVEECLYMAIQVSDILEKPEWWNTWEDYFGRYDPQVYREWMRIWGGTGDISEYTEPGWWQAPQVLTALIDLRSYFSKLDPPATYEDSTPIMIPGP